MSRETSDPNEVPGITGPLFARRDPPTSRHAAEQIAPHLGRHQEQVLDAVRFHPGSTAKELGYEMQNINEDAEHARQRCGRRLNELEKAGLIRRDGVRDGCACWWPGPKVRP
jgi:hypothetical protein